MIFFTFGTERYPFHRLARAAEMTAEQLPGEDVFVQIGHHPEPPRGCRSVQWLRYPEFVESVRKARIVVSHAGTGSILTCNDQGKRPIVLVREARLGEHLDEHQSQLADRMSAVDRIILTRSPEQCVGAILRDAPAQLRPISTEHDEPKLATALASYIAQIARERKPRWRS